MKRKKARAARQVSRRRSSGPKSKLDTTMADIVESQRRTDDPAILPVSPDSPARSSTMTLTFKGLSKNSKSAFYTGAKTVIRFNLNAFLNGTPPQTIAVDDGVFAPPVTPKEKLTQEERIALRAAQPKPTEAERIARMQARLDKRRMRLEAAQSQPSL